MKYEIAEFETCTEYHRISRKARKNYWLTKAHQQPYQEECWYVKEKELLKNRAYDLAKN